ncbi:MAG: Holliday junction ATP-dependent helicase RuvA [Actinomycetota bacterium]|jgi:Holliday junction DNA helicase RuvA|nr:Holliday junction branch migration protein RuvA [Ilumatobacteraceae bacterium]MCX6531772.1 Holliday junction branch migration protein RuvA [Actinomycetota bacterium]
MIGSLRGTVLERTSNSTVLVETNGIGYLVHVTPRTLGELEPTTTAFIYIHHHVREDAQTLYGFLDRDERRCFEILIATHGVGPTMAMMILATHSPRALVDIVAGSDIPALTLVSGVGKKTAERLLIELKSRLHLNILEASNTLSGPSSVGDVRDALSGLGYSTEEIRDVLREMSVSNDSEMMLREALNMLGARRA